MQTNEQAIDQSFAEEAEVLYPRKRSFIWAVLLFAAGLLLGCLPLFYKSGFVPLLQVAGFLLLGVSYAGFAQKRAQDAGGQSFVSALYFCLALILTTAACAYFTHTLRIGDLAVFACSFLLPNAVWAAWRAFYGAAVAPKPLWFYSKEIPEEAPFVYLEKKQVRLRVLTGDKAPEEFTSVVPTTLPLGLIFFYAVKSNRDREQWQRYFLDEAGVPFGWTFYTATLFGRNYLQPHETLFENKVQSGSLLVARRVSTGEEADEIPQ